LCIIQISIYYSKTNTRLVQQNFSVNLQWVNLWRCGKKTTFRQTPSWYWEIWFHLLEVFS